MSKGSQIVPVRFPAELLVLMDQAIARSVDTRMAGPFTRSLFVQKAVEEKLAKMARSAGRPSPIPKTYKRDLSAF